MTPERALEIALHFWGAYVCGRVYENEVQMIEAAVLAACREQAEADAKICIDMAIKCDAFGTEHFCEKFGCHSLVSLADAIRKSAP